MFQSIQPAPADPILGLTEQYKADPNPEKINLAVGVYKDEHGQTPLLSAVKTAERRLSEVVNTKAYLPIEGSAIYSEAVQKLLLGASHPVVTSGRIATAHTPGGTGALRLVGDYLKQNHPDATVWFSTPTWANHHAIFDAAGVPTDSYPYLDREANAIDFSAMVEALEKLPAGDVVLLHGCCHNPSGVDPSPEQWNKIAEIIAERDLLPLVDFAYQGFGEGLYRDAQGLYALIDQCPELLVCTSYSKNFGLYNERVGALSVLTKDAKTAVAVMSRIKLSIRRNYSNPPAHGGAIVSTILNDDELRNTWEDELTAMRNRIHAMRQQLMQGLDDRSLSLGPDGNHFIARQQGMFTLLNLPNGTVDKLKAQHSIYIVGSGRINVAGLTPDNVPRVCDALAQTIQGH
jgi:aspartate/tyrosine/aromatic aminotransferase